MSRKNLAFLIIILLSPAFFSQIKYHESTGPLVGGEQTYSGYYYNFTLVDTNTNSKVLLKLYTDKAFYTWGENVKMTAVLTYLGEPVGKATVLFKVSDPDNATYFRFADITNEKGVASIICPIYHWDSLGNYTVYAAAYHQDVGEASATTTFTVAYLEPKLELWFEAPSISLTKHYTDVLLHAVNVGNGTTYKVNVTLDLPEALTVISANTSYVGVIGVGKEAVLHALVVSDIPGRHLFTSNATYTLADGTPQPTVSAGHVLIYTYHRDYPVDLMNMTVTSPVSRVFMVNLTVTNYGDWDVEVTLIASAVPTQAKATTAATLRTAERTVTVHALETVTVTLEVNIPVTAPSGQYLVQGILATEEGLALTYREGTSTVGVEAPKVYFIEGSDSGTACTVTMGTNNTWVQISGMRGWPNATRVYENATAIHNADDRSRNVLLSSVSWSGDTSYAAITVKVYDSNGTQEGGVINVGTEGSNTGSIVIPAGQNFRIQWEIKWAAEATTSHSVSVTLSLRAEE